MSEIGEEIVEYRKKNVQVTDKSPSIDIKNGHRPDMSSEVLLHKFEFDEFGSTPPRTRIKNKNRDWDRRQKLETAARVVRGVSRMARTRASRRNTLDCAILNDIFIEDDTKKCDKRSIQLLRESERDIKLSSGIIQPTTGMISPSHVSPNKSITNTITKNDRNSMAIVEERAESSPVGRMCLSNNLSVVPKLVESNNRYMSVSSRPIGCRSSAPAFAFMQKDLALGPNAICPLKPKVLPAANQDEKMMLQTRQDFHETFANLIKLGSCDKQDGRPSNEDYTWQTELKDIIWLELQAWHADRTLEQQDKYLYSARQGIPDLLTRILNYKFVPKYSREISVSSTDSGISTCASAPSTPEINENKNRSYCRQCYSMYCRDCQEQQTIALREIEELLTRLEAAEALYPSSQVLGNFHPDYKSPEFVGRVKAMCLWYNITRHQRLKLLIVGKIFARLHGKTFQWPVSADRQTDSSASSSVQENEDSSRDSVDSRKLIPQRIPRVKFTFDGESNQSPADSVSSNDSNNETTECSIQTLNPESDLNMDDYQLIFKHVDSFNIGQSSFTGDVTTSPYRKYIEHVLKSRGLGQALSFLHHLHNVVLRKAHATLEIPGSEETDLDFEGFDDNISHTEIPLSKEEEEDLHRYGAWSEEATSLCLPSYIPAFVFLSVMPLEVMHEYLRMRLESKPLTPNPLSLEQLMKELREGLILAMTHRERFSKHIHTAFYDKENELDKYTNILENYDATVKIVMDLYLEYVEQWVLVAAPEGHRKNALDREWMFSYLISPMIFGQHAIVARKFCQIVRDLLQITGDRLIKRSQELDNQIKQRSDIDEDEKKWQILTACREIQSLFTLEREKTMRLINFAKSLCRDLEKPDFHREHENMNDQYSDDVVCTEVKESVLELQKDVLSVRIKLTMIIERVQERCDMKYLLDMNEVDKMSILSRAREILHQGYKFGFEYHKDISRLFETKIVCCKDKSCEQSLALGIINFAKMWMKFVTERCERGRGVRPRWATQGLEFLIAACDPSNTRHLSENEFDDLKTKMDACISHVVGIGAEPENIRKRASPRSRKVSPGTNRPITPTRTLSPRVPGDHRNFLNSISVREEAISAPNTPELVRKQSSCDQVDTNQTTLAGGTLLRVPRFTNYGPALRQIRVRDAVNSLDLDLERKLRERNLIGQVKAVSNSDKIQLRARSVNFRWHRGIKIGQGRFGKVYTAVNNSTGELMAMKEIAIQPGETRAIRNVAEELKIFEGISHKHLVRLYGVEIHREELLIFMELCPEGTLESLVEVSGGLHEVFTRRYTVQLLDAVAELHRHGVVHRDIKPGNIFLTKTGNCLKLGDFGCAVKIQAHTTVTGELQGYVGTQAYMAPEVFTKNHTDGHGRAVDIWSVGCVVIEMASGKRPWAQFDSNFQIMFKVGMGESPEIPDSLSEEGQEFVEHCLQHDPKERWLATELLQHNFCKVDLQDDTNIDDKQ